VIDAALDVAGLPVPEHSCCLLPGELCAQHVNEVICSNLCCM
jgi:hypothetical protein